MGTAMEVQLLHVIFLLVNVSIALSLANGAKTNEFFSAVGDPGMRGDGLRVGFEAWNFCNEVGKEAPGMGSPRAADCFDLSSKQNHHRRKQTLKSICSFFLYLFFSFLKNYFSNLESLL